MICNVYNKGGAVIDKKKIIAAVAAVFKREDKTGEVSVHFVSENKIKEMNKKYRGVDQSTDVLSFAIREGVVVGEKVWDWGDIFISLAKIKTQAKDYGVSHEEELDRMLAHGILHLFGHNHENHGDAKKMFRIQEEIINKL